MTDERRTLAAEIFRHPFMLALKLDGKDPLMCEVHGVPLLDRDVCPFVGAGCAAPYPAIGTNLSEESLRRFLDHLKTKTLETTDE